MECYCSEDSFPEVMWETTHTARKSHECYECGSPIDPGEKYMRVSGVWNGDFEAFKMCSTCEELWRYVRGDGCVLFGELWATVGNEFEDLVGRRR